jgi:hypothetical protein
VDGLLCAASAVTLFWDHVDDIARTRAATDAGRIAKGRCAYAALRGQDEAVPRRLALLKSALADLVAGWDAEAGQDTDQSADDPFPDHPLLAIEGSLAELDAAA